MDILFALFTGNKDQDKVMRNLDLSYMTPQKYGTERHEITERGKKLLDGDLPPQVRRIHILAHGSPTDIDGQSGEDFAQRLFDSFGRKGISNDRTIILYSCEAAQGGDNSVMTKMINKFLEMNVTNFRLIAGEYETFIMSTGEVRVLKSDANSDKLSRQVEGKGGAERDKAANQYIQDFGKGWKGIRIQQNKDRRDLNEDEIKSYLVKG